MKFRLTVHSNELTWLNDLYGKEPKEQDLIGFTKADITLQYFSKKEKGKGFGITETIVNLAVNIAVGVPAGIIANIIYDKIMKQGKNKLVIKEKELTILTKDELITYIEKSIEEC